jgi:hypothetical protein
MRRDSRGTAITSLRFGAGTASVVALVLVALSVRAAPQDSPVEATNTNGERTVLDRVAVRFYSPETGGSARPRFITERILSFEARLIAMSEQGASAEIVPQERHLRLAMERHVTEELLSSLGIEGTKDTFGRDALADEARLELENRIGGSAPLARAAAIEQVEPEEVQGIFLRHARAVYYLDRHVTPLLAPSDDQLRDAFRSAAHPYRNKKFEDVRKDFARWFVAERVKAVESTFLQTARARVKIIVIGH